MVWRLLDEAFGESEEEQFERAEKEYNQYRRLPGQPVAAYLGQMKRLKAQYQRVDPETHISDRAWGQRLLNRCSLSRRERLDVFFSAGGTYDPVSIERAIRHRCASTHEDERRVPVTRPPKVTRPRGGYDEKKKFVKKTYRKVYVADQDPEGPEPEDEDLEEELEGEAEEMQEALIQDHDPDDTEELRAIDEEEGSDGDHEEVQEELREAYTAGWKAKARMNDKKKSRGWSAGPSQSTLPPSVAQKKQASHCASCGQKGHWGGDPQCPNVLSGKDKPHVKKTGILGATLFSPPFTSKIFLSLGCGNTRRGWNYFLKLKDQVQMLPKIMLLPLA